MKKHQKNVNKELRALFSDRLRANITEGLAGAVLFLALVGWIAAYGVGAEGLLLIAAMTQSIWWLCILGVRRGIKRRIDRSASDLEQRGLSGIATAELADKDNYFLDNREAGATEHFIILKNTGDILSYSGIAWSYSRIAWYSERITEGMRLTLENGEYRVKYYLTVGREYSTDKIEVYLGEDHPEQKAARIIALIEQAAQDDVQNSEKDISEKEQKARQRILRRSMMKDAKAFGALALGLFACVQVISVMALYNASHGMEDMKEAVILSVLLQAIWMLPFIACIRARRSVIKRLKDMKKTENDEDYATDKK